MTAVVHVLTILPGWSQVSLNQRIIGLQCWFIVLLYSGALLQATVLLALLQPAPETFELFDDIMLLSEGASCSVAADVLSPPRTDTTGIFQHALSGRLSAIGHVNKSIFERDTSEPLNLP